MHVAALPAGFGQHLVDGFLQSRMVTGDNEFHTGQAPLLQSDQEVLPTALALTVGQLDGKHLLLPLPVDADGYQNRPLADYPVLPDLLIARIED